MFYSDPLEFLRFRSIMLIFDQTYNLEFIVDKSYKVVFNKKSTLHKM